MGVTKPYNRIYRPVNPKLQNSGYSSWAYIPDEKYCQSGHSYVRAFLLILEELQNLFQFIEPCNDSMNTFSYKIHSLFMRTCIEIEANFKAILTENIYTPKTNKFGPIYNMSVYKKINTSHHLSSYKVGLPQWASKKLLIFEPFKKWNEPDGRIKWYQAYNESKHDRQDNFRRANMDNLLNAIAGLLVAITSQFRTETFSLSYATLHVGGGAFPNDMVPSIGSTFLISYPNDWTENEMYDFDWAELKSEDIRFQKYDYDT